MQKQELYPAEVADAVRFTEEENPPDFEVWRYEGEHTDGHLCVKMDTEEANFHLSPLDDWEMVGMWSCEGVVHVNLRPEGSL